MKALLKRLSEAQGVSGFEDDVREILIKELEPFTDYIGVDDLGNLIATREGEENAKNIMLAAHMDEIGLMVKYIDDDGFLKFTKIGGINDQMLLNHDVTIHTPKGPVLGVIGSKPPHRMKAEEKKKITTHDKMFIDIGASSKEEAEKKVNVGDPITIRQKFHSLTRDRVMGKAFDNRVGCAILVEVMKQVESKATIHAVGTVQEEVGLKGARTSAYRLNPDLALALDVTIAGDHPGIQKEDAPSKLGGGPAITLLDAGGRGIITHPHIKELLINVAQEEDIPYHVEVSEGGTTDASVIHLTRRGIPTGVVSVPTRYIHTPVSVVSMQDIHNTVKLILGLLGRL